MERNLPCTHLFRALNIQMENKPTIGIYYENETLSVLFQATYTPRTQHGSLLQESVDHR